MTAHRHLSQLRRLLSTTRCVIRRRGGSGKKHLDAPSNFRVEATREGSQTYALTTTKLNTTARIYAFQVVEKHVVKVSSFYLL